MRLLKGKLKKSSTAVIASILFLGLFLPACGPGPIILPSPSPAASTSTPAPEPTATEIKISMRCADEVLINSGEYRVENNTWGKGSLSGWSQCIGIAPGAGGAIAARWTWDWLKAGSNIKAYPEIIFGQKPGSTTTTKALPVKLSDIGQLTVSYDVTSSISGSGNVAFDLWLTDTSNPTVFKTPPITQEIMVWLDRQGGLGPNGSLKERVTIKGSTYAVFVAPKWGEGWEYIAFISPEPHLGAGVLDLGSLLAYLQDKNLASGDAYLASIEFGNEIAIGSGETIVKSYSVELTKK